MRKYAQLIIAAVCITLSAAAFYNVMGDNAHVEEMAKNTACEGEDMATCHPKKTMMGRSPLAQEFGFETAKGQVQVRCKRSAYFFGSYSCAKR